MQIRALAAPFAFLCTLPILAQAIDLENLDKQPQKGEKIPLQRPAEASKTEPATQAQNENSSPAADAKRPRILEVSARMQLRALYYGASGLRDRNDEGERLLKYVPAQGDNGYAGFSARRLRLSFEGDFNPQWSYQLDLKVDELIQPIRTDEEIVYINNNGTPTSKTVQVVDRQNSALNDAFFLYKLRPQHWIYIGSAMIPYSREAMTGSFNLLSPERSLPADYIAFRRDLGLQARGEFLKVLHYGAGIFGGAGGLDEAVNGPGKLSNGNYNRTPFFSGRLSFDPLGEYRSGKSQFTGETLVSVGVGALYQKQGTSGRDPFKSETQNIFGSTIDIGGNWRNITAEAAVFYLESTNADGGKWVYRGASAQVGVLLWRMLQPFLKYEMMQDTGMWQNGNQPLTHVTRVIYNKTDFGAISGGRFQDLSTTQYITGGVNWYLEENDLKLTAVYVLGLNRGADTTALQYSDYGMRDDWFGFQMQMKIKSGRTSGLLED